MKGIIYCYTAPNGKKYIGQTKYQERRKNDFLKCRNYAGFKIDNARKKYGPENFKYEILLEIDCDDLNILSEKLNEAEIEFIKKYGTIKNGLNISNGGVPKNTIIFNEDAKQRMIKSLKEYNKKYGNSFKGHHHTEETKRILREKALGRPSGFKGKHWTEEQRIKKVEQTKIQCKGEGNPFYGKKHTEKTKRIIGEKNSKSVVKINKETYEILKIYTSAIDAGKELGNPRINSEIIKVCKGYVNPTNGKHYKTSHGFIWKYTKDIEGSTTIESDGKMYYRPKVEYDSSESEMGDSLKKDEDIVSSAQ